MLGDSLAYYEATGKKLYNTSAQSKAVFPWLQEVDRLCQAESATKRTTTSWATESTLVHHAPRQIAYHALHSTNNQNT